ncbi:MAG: phosphoribosylformylglycinamidine cyclo-ligase [Endomicrobia bacterium]|nr:phosphoribosylformylglycinamidine cyclo-ligase [Endomicrobiia bacterium]MDW8056272.1 phosphoribosylformylglycinamidine cyclo-ligase [Elusimicrobiota bacterium]
MLTYKKSGVDIDEANKFVKWIQKKFPQIGFFSGFYKINKQQYLVATTDGVGTKLKIAQLVGKHNTVGIDLVAMNVNDIITCGAKPLFFLDYIACGKVNFKVLTEIMTGIIKGCNLAKCTLLGGETAEMPGMYKPNEYDLAGFACGIVKEEEIINGSHIIPGDVIIGLFSSGLHSNGYSLVRKVFTKYEQIKLARVLLEPTKIYVDEIMELLKKFEPNKEIKAIVNITGGGFYDNIIRVLPENIEAQIDKNLWKPPKIFSMLQQKGKIQDKEMYRTFNMGIGMTLIVSYKVAYDILNFLNKDAVLIGKIFQSKRKKVTILGIN